ncbi:MAG: hypothetical protein P9L94_02020 [Candidatus Hinthialibacter antarcticus]|nr:hypothetical protein [Candidatus Hinthialibacter antarcticus]
MIGASGNGTNVVYRFDAAINASIHINGTQIPPIDVQGRIINFSLNMLHFECDRRIPIPARGKLIFILRGSEDPLEIPVDIVSRAEMKKGFWSWSRSERFEFRLAIRSTNHEEMERYQRHMHRLIFGEAHVQGINNGASTPQDDTWS